MKGRVTLAGVSIILVVGAVIGAIVIHRNNSDNKDQLSTSSKIVSTICGPTDYKQACVQSLGSLATNQSATPKQLIEAAINATIQEVKSALEKSGKLAGNSASNGTEKMSMDDCQELLQFAVDELQASFSMVGDSELHRLKDREAELLNWLSAVISYQQTCLDGINQPDLKNEMSNGLQNATQLTSNALAIISAISDILGTLNIPFNITSSTASSRRLLEQSNGTDTPDERAYPSWFTAADRRLLASQSNGGVKPNAVVAKDGSGQFKTIGAALAAYPKNLRGRYVIYVKAGVYNEYLTVTKDQVNVFMYGDGPRKTLITGSKSNRDGISTYQTASFSAIGNGFIAKSIGFQNTAGPAGEQAVALRVQSDMSAFYNCRMDAYQDTLYVQVHHQFYRNCVISGTVDFIFGDAAAIIQNSLIIVRRPLDGQKNAVTAQGRSDKHETSGIVIHNCRIVPEQKLVPVRFQIPTYLGRPWKMYSRTVVMESTLGDLIQPAGWMEWAGNFALDTLDYREYANRGPGAVTSRRVRWKGYKVITNRNEALQFTAGPFIRGDLWLRYTGARYFLGLRP